MNLRLWGQFLLENQLTFELGYRNAMKNAHCGFHSHESFELVYHAKGSGYFVTRFGEKIGFEEKDVVIHPPRLRHDQMTNLPGEDVCIHFSAPRNLWPALGEYLRITSLEGLSVTNEILSLADTHAPITPMEKAACNHSISTIVARLLLSPGAPVADTGNSQRDYASAALAYIRENLATITNLEHVAQAVGIGYDHLRHLFRKKFGRSMKDQLSAIRLEKAKRLLAQTPLPLKAIAGMCGYTSDRYFCMAFRSMERMTPGEFRGRKARSVSHR